MRVILVLTLLLFVVEFIQCLKRTCVESASNKYVENLFKPLVAVQDRQDFDNNNSFKLLVMILKTFGYDT